jgi:two-component system response regulator HydG
VTKLFFSYDWPGNVRQLRNFVETMVVLDTDGVLGEDDLPPELMDPNASVSDASPSLTIGGGMMSESALLGQPLAAIEKWAIEETLRLTGGNREEAAKVLGIGARTLYRRLDQYKKDDPNWNESEFVSDED